MSRFDTIVQSLFSTPMVVLAIACALTIGTFFIEKMRAKERPTEKGNGRKKCGKGGTKEGTKEGFNNATDIASGIFGSSLVNLFGGRINQVQTYNDNPSGAGPSDLPKEKLARPDRVLSERTFTKKPLDQAYDDYEATELEAAAEDTINSGKRYITVTETVLPDFGAAFKGGVDSEIKQIPWDSDNKDQLPSDILWGIVSPEASKSIYAKSYANTVLSDPTLYDNPAERELIYHSPILNINAYDQNTAMGLQAFEGIATAQGQRISPFGGDLYERYSERGFFPKPSVEPLQSLVMEPRKVLGDLKVKLGVPRAKAFLKKISAKMSNRFTTKIGAFFATYFAKKATMRALMYGANAGFAVGAALTGGILAGVLAVSSTIIFIISRLMDVIDAISVVLYGILPTILDKVIDVQGICLEGKTLESLIDNETAYFWFVNFVPIADLLDLIGPYTCWDNGKLKPKVPVSTPPYYYDKTLSLRYHQYPANETIRGSSYEMLPPYIDPAQYECIDGICYSKCPPRTWTNGKKDLFCRQIEYSIKVTNPTFTSCQVLQDQEGSYTSGLSWRDDGQACWEDVNPTTGRGCGCVKKTQLERNVCPSGYEIDPTDVKCYESCAPGYTRIGTACWGDTRQSVRSVIQPSATKRWDAGYLAKESLNSITFPWCNFANPIMLDRMAQFYYDQSSLHPTILESEQNPGVTLIEWEYISKFYGVIASSELSCDVACEIITMRYNPYTGEEYTESSGCSYGDDDDDTMCYRRFYFIKGESDPQGIFTVTGCTNSDYTAPDAQVSSFDEGVDYVPSLPKIFTVEKQSTPPGWSMNDLTDIGTGLLGGFAGQFAGRFGALGGSVAGVVSNIGSQKLNEYIKNYNGMSQAKAEASESDYLVKSPSDNIAFVVFGTKSAIDGGVPAYMTIHKGPIKEQAAGILPALTRCSKFQIDAAQCAYKYTLHDTINRYEAKYPNRRVKQVDLIEPRGRDACYYRWKEVVYDTTNNKEGVDIIENEVIHKYTIKDKNTCIFEPDISGNGPFVSIKDAPYPIRTFIFNGATAYPTRKAITKPVRYVRIELANPNNRAILRLSQVVVYNTDLQNVAKFKTVTASEAKAGAPPANAVDGKEVPRMEPNIYVSSIANAYFEVDLGEEESIQSITVYNGIKRAGAPDANTYMSALANYRVICLDAVRQVNYTFILTGAEKTTLDGFPALALHPRLPYKPFLVPKSIPQETTLGGDKCPDRTCANPAQMNRLILEFNAANPKTKIMKVSKAVTPKVDRCDYEVEMMRIVEKGTNILQRETVAITVAETTDTACLFKRVKDESATLNSGTFIQENTPPLEDVSGSSPLMLYDGLAQDATNSLNTNFYPIQRAEPLKEMRKNVTDTKTSVNNTLAYFMNTQTLDGCPSKCRDPGILQAIYDGYNTREVVSTEQLGVERNTMLRIQKVGAFSPTECDILFEEKYEAFDDVLYAPQVSTSRYRSARIKLEKVGGPNSCTFSVSPSATGIRDISSNSVSLMSASATLATPFVGTPCAVECQSDATIAAVKQALEVAAGSTSVYTKLLQTYRNGTSVCEYKIQKNSSEQDPYTKQWSVISDIDVYVKANFTKSADQCKFTLASVKEYEMDRVEELYNLSAQQYDTYYNGQKVVMPILYNYDEAVPSPYVNATVKQLV